MPAAAAPTTIRTQPHHGTSSPDSSSPVVEVGLTTATLAALWPPWVTVSVVVTVLAGVGVVFGGGGTGFGGWVTVSVSAVVIVLAGVVLVVWASVAAVAVVCAAAAADLTCCASVLDPPDPHEVNTHARASPAANAGTSLVAALTTIAR